MTTAGTTEHLPMRNLAEVFNERDADKRAAAIAALWTFLDV